MMKRHSRVSILLLAACFLGVIVCGPMTVCAEEESSPYNIPQGVYLDMNKDFYKALSNQGGTKVLTTDPSRVYLQMVLKNQEEIIKKLDLLLEKKN